MYKLLIYLFLTIVLSSSHLLAKEKLKDITLQLQWKHQFEFAGFYAAKEKGFYREIGLNVDFKEHDGKNNIIETVLNKKAHFGLTYSSLISEYLKGKDVVFVANYLKQSPLVLVTNKNIRTPKDLKGKKIMGVSDEINSITFKLMLQKFDISLNDIVSVPTTFKLDSFINGDVDAMAIFTTNEIYQLDKLGVNYNLFNPTLYGNEYYDLNLFTSKTFANHNFDLIEKFKEATKKGWEYALDNKEEIIELILAKYNTQNKTKEALLFEALQIEQLTFRKTEEIGSISPLRVKLIANSFIESNYSNLNKLDEFIFNNPSFFNNKLELTKLEKLYINNNKNNEIYTDINMEPLVLVNSDIFLNGYIQDVITLINEVSGLNIQLILNTKKEIDRKFNENKINLITTRVKNEFMMNYSKSESILNIRKMIFTNSYIKDEYIKIDDFNGKVFGLLEDDSLNLNLIKGLKDTKIRYFKTFEDLVNAVSRADIDAMIGDDETAYKLKKMGNNFLKPSIILDKNNLSVTFNIRDEDDELLSIINKSLNYIGREKLASLKQKWFYNSTSISLNKFILNKEELEYVSSKKTINMCTDPFFEPYEKIDEDGKHIGIVAEFIKLIENKIGLKFKLIPTKNWLESMHFIKEGKCEVLSFLNETTYKKEFLNFTPTIYSESEVIISKNEVDYLDGYESLNGKSVAVVQGYRTQEFLKEKYPLVNFIYVKNQLEALEKVTNGQTDATINSLLGTAFLIRKLDLVNIKIAGKTEFINEYKMGVIKSEDTLLSILSKVISSLDEEEKNVIIKKAVPVRFEMGTNFELLWKILFFISIVIIIFIFRHFTIKRINQKLQHQMEEQLKQLVEKDRMIFQQNKLTSMGEMIENISHQWRQPLSQINSAILVIDDELHKLKMSNDLIEEKLSEVESVTKYMSKTVDDFRQFYSKDKKSIEFCLNESIDYTISIVNGAFKYNRISLEKQINEQITLIGLPNELQQALLILLNNAKDALILNSKKNPNVVIKAFKSGIKTIIEVSDNAGGIKEENLEKVFEPYFTTKHKSQGTGLGLYIAKLIIEEGMKGSLKVSNDEEGACFTIILPLK